MTRSEVDKCLLCRRWRRGAGGGAGGACHPPSPSQVSGAVRGSDGKGQVTESERHLAKIRYGCGARLLRSDTNTANVMVLAVSRVSRLNGTDVALKPEGVLQFQQVSFFLVGSFQLACQSCALRSAGREEDITATRVEEGLLRHVAGRV